MDEQAYNRGRSSDQPGLITQDSRGQHPGPLPKAKVSYPQCAALALIEKRAMIEAFLDAGLVNRALRHKAMADAWNAVAQTQREKK